MKGRHVWCALVLVAASLAHSYLWRCSKKRGSMQFEFGETDQANAFFDRNPKFHPAFERLMTLANKCFGRKLHPKSRIEDVCFDLGHTCRADYMEILFLAVNGFGIAASKLLRGLYERAVTLAYIIKHPEKAERFVRYAAIQEKKAMDRALEVVTEEQFNEVIQTTSTTQIRALYEQVKPEFQVTHCKKCGHKGAAFSWDIDVASMVRDVGDPYDKYFLGSFTIPTLHIHATLASVAHEPDEAKKLKRSQQEAEFALMNATVMLILAMRSQNALFKLDLDSELNTSEEDLVEVFVTR